MSLTIRKLARAAGVSTSHLGRIERGERFPSARVLRKITKPLDFEEIELLILAGYLSSQTTGRVESETQFMRLDPYVIAVLSQEPVEIQSAVVTIVSLLKSMAKEIAKGIGCNIEFAEYARRKYPELDEDIIAMVEDLINRGGDRGDR